MICFNSGDKDTQIFENCAICKILHAKRQIITSALYIPELKIKFAEKTLIDYGTPNCSK